MFFAWRRGILGGVFTAVPRTELPAMSRAELPAISRIELPADHWTDVAGVQSHRGGPFEMAS